MKKMLPALVILFLLINPSVVSASGSGCYDRYFSDDCLDANPKTPVEYYSPSTGEIFCQHSCWHEVAHKIDHEVVGDISQDHEFHNAIAYFLFSQMKRDEPIHPMTMRILLFPGFFEDWHIFSEDKGKWSGYVWGGYDELYAEILDWAQGDIDQIPEVLRPFYNMDMANKFYDEVMK